MELEPSTFSVRSAFEYCAGDGPRAGGCARHHRHGRGRRRRRHDRRRRAAVQAGGAQPALQRGQVHPRRRKRVRSRAYRDGTDLVVTVTDTGIGVPTEDQERIFESFQQGGRGAPKEEGTGLGLTLSRRIVGLFGGRMWLESRSGVGSTFGFSIPGVLRVAGRGRLARSAARAARRPARRRRPGVAGPDLGLPGRLADAGAAGHGRRRGSRAGAQGAACRRGARHPAAAARRLAGAGRAQGGPGHRRHPGGHRLDRRRAGPRPGPRRGCVPAQAGRPRGADRCAASSVGRPTRVGAP